MKTGDEVISTVEIDSFQMYYETNVIPKEYIIPKGSYAIIEELYKSGWGIVKLENGNKLLLDDVENKFVRRFNYEL